MDVKLTELARSGGSCGKNGCPAVYATDDPTVVVVQGKKLDAGTTSELTGVAEDELGVAIPKETILRAAALLSENH